MALFEFDLPASRIALHPKSPRRDAGLLYVIPDGPSPFSLKKLGDLPDLLRKGDLLVCNDTKVLPARLFARKARESGAAHIGLTLDRPLGPGNWRALVKNSRRLHAGDALHFILPDRGPGGEELYYPHPGRVKALKENGIAEVDFSAIPDAEFQNFLNAAGKLALPPYIARPNGPTEQDQRDYQTIFSRFPGAVAAPTAGLHFTRELLDQLARKGVERCFLTLHVGAGTFLPVRSTPEKHKMHPEWGEISPEAAEKITRARREGRRIVAVGTTSLRLIESATDGQGTTHPWRGETDIFIRPGYEFRGVDCLMTNFHLSRSTLFMLVCAFAGIRTMHKAYQLAIKNNWRFYSYGDACFLERRTKPEAA